MGALPLLQRDEGAWLATRSQGIEAKGLAFPRRHGALGCAAPIVPPRLVARGLQRRPIARAIAQKHDLGPFGEARAPQFDQRNVPLLRTMPLGALAHAPRQGQGASLLDHVDHQGCTVAAYDTPIHHQHERL